MTQATNRKSTDELNQAQKEVINLQTAIRAVTYGSIALGLIIAAINNSWTGLLVLGGGSLALYILAQFFLAEKPVYKYIVSGIYSLLALMIMWVSGGSPAVHLIVLVYLAALILFSNWRTFIPFTAIIISAIVIVGIIRIRTGESYLINVGEQLNATFMAFYVGILAFNAALCSFIAEFQGKITNRFRGAMEQLVQLEEYTENNIEYARQIASGNFDVNYEMKGDDILGQSLVEMSKNLKQAALEEKRRNWSVEGIAQTADILRISHENIDELCYNVVSHLVKYIKANQGGIFILNDEEQDDVHLELKGCYAFNRRKFMEKKVSIGEGLVGQAYLEKEMIYMTDIPENYVHITSGLGDANPSSIMITPLKVEEQVIGIIELASFKKFEDHERQFLEKVSENIASAIISSKVKDQTNKLLKESQEMTEEMRAQEEEMRQNMEELQATQENLQRESKEKEKMQREVEETRDFLQNIINAIPDPVFVKTRDDHRFILVNKAWEDNYSKGQNVIGKNDYDLFPKEMAEKYYQDEEKLFEQRADLNVEEKGMKDGREIFNITKKRVVENEKGEMFLVGINHEITDLKKAQEALAKEKYLLDALMGSATDCIYFKDKESKFIRVSDNMLSNFNVNSQEEIAGKSDFDFFTEEHARPAFEAEQEIINTGKPALNLIEKETWEDGRITFVSTSKMPLKDLDGNIIGTFGISRDITKARKAELELAESEQRMVNLLKYVGELVLVTDVDLNYQLISPNFSQQLGFDHNQLISHSLLEYIHKDDVSRVEKELKKLKSDQESVLQYRHKNAAGKFLSMEAVVKHTNDDEAIKGYIYRISKIK